MLKEKTVNPPVFATLDCGNLGRQVCNKYEIKVGLCIK